MGGVIMVLRGTLFLFSPWTFPQKSVEFSAEVRGLFRRSPWTFPQKSVDFSIKVRGLYRRSPWTFASKSADFIFKQKKDAPANAETPY